MLLLSLSGCAGIYRGLAGDSRLQPVRSTAAAVLNCAEPIVVEERDYFHDMQFLAKGCQRETACMEIGDRFQCFKNPPRLANFGKERLPDGFLAVATSVAAITGCPSSDARPHTVGEINRAGVGVFTASICDRDFTCTTSGRVNLEAECSETKQSVETTNQKVVVDRLQLETGCDRKEIRIVSDADWGRGTERAYRMTACGTPFVCTTAPGRTDCKAALQSPLAPVAAGAPASAQGNGSATIAVYPVANVFWEGVDLGKTTLNVSLPAGTHVLTVVGGDAVKRALTVQVESGKNTLIKSALADIPPEHAPDGDGNGGPRQPLQH